MQKKTFAENFIFYFLVFFFLGWWRPASVHQTFIFWAHTVGQILLRQRLFSISLSLSLTLSHTHSHHGYRHAHSFSLSLTLKRTPNQTHSHIQMHTDTHNHTHTHTHTHTLTHFFSLKCTHKHTLFLFLSLSQLFCQFEASSSTLLGALTCAQLERNQWRTNLRTYAYSRRTK